MSQGITFFNFGGGCMMRLLVALHSLRDHYKGPVTLQLAKDDDFNERALEDLQAPGDVDIQWFELEALAKRNLKSVLKPTLFKMSPYDQTLMLDGDLLIQRDPSELFPHIEEKGFLVTRFSTWNCDGKRMRGRVQRCRKWLEPEYYQSLLSGRKKVPAVNIGVMGWSKGADAVLADWEQMTMNLAGTHIADEVACQCVFPRNEHYVAGETWNSSCLYGVQAPADAAILHYHGNKHTRLDNLAARRWLKYAAQLLKDGKIQTEGILTWRDKSLIGRLRETPSVFADALLWED